MSRAVLLVAAALLLAAGCTTRDRSNPLDPRNTSTLGGLVGFDAVAADRVVEFRWPLLPVQGVLGYRVQRWIPGGVPRSIGSADYLPDVIGGEDSTVTNDSTYVYRLVAHLASGDSAVSAPDTVTPGTRQIYALAAGVPAFLRLSPDGRDVLYSLAGKSSYVDMEMDRRSGYLWLADESNGEVIRKVPDGATVGVTLSVPEPGDLSVSSNRGLGWVVSVANGSVDAYGPDLTTSTPFKTILDVTDPRIVEAGTIDPSVWVGSEEGQVVRYRALDLARTNEWSLGAVPIRAIALDESTGGAWVATRAATATLYYLNPADGSSVAVRSSLLNPADLAVDAAKGDLWISERGPSNLGAGRVTLIDRAGATLATVGGLEPYGIDVDPSDGSCWVADLRSNRLLRVSRTGAIVRASPLLETPYAVRVSVP